ncbi:MAG: flagellar type III secretion system pore protein FliP [Gammaproteobacteria bacterium]|nr:flagellar type III secretion system pore protein FliP [Gammaproteobacteria bacterium]
MMRLLLVVVLTLYGADAFAAGGLPAVSVVADGNGGQSYTLSIQVLLLMTALTVLPALVLAMTSFTRIIIVLSILRQALGTAQTPPNQVLIGVALFLTLFIMAPVLQQIHAEAVQPYVAGELEFDEVVTAASTPLREFMLAQTRESDLALLSGIAQVPDIATPADVPMTLLIPSFIISELKTAFQIGFLMFIPFLIIDLVVSSVLMSMGMMMLSPMLISLPFKLMLFVLVDGWALIVGTLAASFYV